MQFYHFHNIPEQARFKIELEKLPHQNIAVWETCLRKIIFFDSSESEYFAKNKQLNESYQVKTDQEALEFLIEVLCGLQSNLIGETEVFGQFRKFIDSPEAQKVSFLKNSSLMQFVFQQVKETREKHLTGFAVHSYGSLIRKKCLNFDEICILGNGHLTQEIIPWIKNKKIKIHVRNHQRFSPTKYVTYHEINQTDLAGIVIVAAPIGTKELKIIFNQQHIKQVIDCRALDEQQYSLKQHISVPDIVELKDLFNLLDQAKSKIAENMPLIKRAITTRVQQHLLKGRHRPQGWEDLCG